MSFTVDYKLIGAWERDFSVRSSHRGKMTTRLYWGKGYISIRDFNFHKVEREDRIKFVSALIDHLKSMKVSQVSAWFFKGSTARHSNLLLSLGFIPYRDDQWVHALRLDFD